MQEAIAFYTRAIELDPNFAMAYDRLAVIHRNQGDPAKAAAYAQQAYDRRARVSEREQLSIQGSFQVVTGDTASARRTFEVLKQTYPRDPLGPGNLSFLLFAAGEFEAAIPEALESYRRDPSSPLVLSNLCAAYIALNRLEEAKTMAVKALETRRAFAPLWRCRYVVAHLEGDTAAMERIIADGTQAGAAAQMGHLKIRTNIASGRLRDAGRLISALAGPQGNQRPLLAEELAGYGYQATILGALPLALSLVDRSMQMNPDAASWSIPPVLFAARQTSRAAAIHSASVKRFSGDTNYANMWLPAAEAESALARGDPARALEILERSQQYERARPNLALTRGQALLAAGRADEAAVAFQRAYDARRVIEPNALGPVAQVWLARARAKAGDSAGARRAYQEAFRIWKDGDFDLPILVAARKEYGGLAP